MRDRVRDYALLLAASALLTLPNLGIPSFWDLDEGINAQTAREMQDAGTWVIPTFNYQLRTAKPVMLYWLQRLSYAAFGVNEWSARLPSVLAGWLAVLLTYELARSTFGRATGLLAGLILTSAIQFGILAHAATPDATLLAFSTLAYLLFWIGHAGGQRRWWIPVAAACGLAVLTKGPVGLVLPAVVIVLYFAWNRQLARLLDRRLVWAALTFILVAGPWYALVATETRGEWVKTFLATENLGRFLAPMDRHGGPMAYYLLALPVMFAPWSVFLVPLVWCAARGTKRNATQEGTVPPVPSPGEGGGLDLLPDSHGERGLEEEAIPCDERYPQRFLICWIATYVVFFSFAATKLPNYVFPVYPALAILTARFLVGWRENRLAVPGWVMLTAVIGMALVGVGYVAGLMVAARTFPELSPWAVVGLVPIVGAARMAWCLRQGNRGGLVTTATVVAMGFIGLTVAFPTGVLEEQKAPRELVRVSGVGNPERDVRVAAYNWHLASVVYYCGREVKILESVERLATFLAVPTPGYVFVPEPTWNLMVATMASVPHRIAARHYDFLEKCNILVITNEVSDDVAKQ